MAKKPMNPEEIFHPDVLKRFLDKLQLGENDCIEWTGSLNVDGYGQISVGSREQQRKIPSHRWGYQFAIGGVILPSDVMVCHKCDNPACVNPLHHFEGSHQDNMDDMKNKGRSAVSFGNAKLNWEIVDYIRSSPQSGNSLRKELGIAKSTVSEIRNNHIWREEDRDKALLPDRTVV